MKHKLTYYKEQLDFSQDDLGLFLGASQSSAQRWIQTNEVTNDDAKEILILIDQLLEKEFTFDSILSTFEHTKAHFPATGGYSNDKRKLLAKKFKKRLRIEAQRFDVDEVTRFIDEKLEEIDLSKDEIARYTRNEIEQHLPNISDNIQSIEKILIKTIEEQYIILDKRYDQLRRDKIKEFLLEIEDDFTHQKEEKQELMLPLIKAAISTLKELNQS